MAQTTPSIQTVELNLLKIDLKNSRFGVDQDTEAKAIELLFAEYDVIKIVNSILVEGYRATELPLVIEDGDYFVVLEANRRISALKALKDPSLVPDFESNIKTLIKRYKTEHDNLPSEIPVYVFPDRQSAAPLLARMHIGLDKKRWELDEQAKFVISQIESGVTIQYIRDTFPGIKDVVGKIRMGKVREALTEVNFTDSTLRDFALSADLKMSVMKYAYDAPDLRRLMGFKFDKEGNVTSKPTSDREIYSLERILRGIKKGELNTRKVLNKRNSQEFKNLVAELETGGPNVSVSARELTCDVESITSNEVKSVHHEELPSTLPVKSSSITSDNSKKVEISTHRSRNRPESQDKLEVYPLQRLETTPAFQARVSELRRLSLSEHPTAAVMMLRALLEGAIKEHFRTKNYTVNDTLGTVVKELQKTYKNERSISQAVDLLNGGRGNRVGSIKWLNNSAHSIYESFPREEIHQAYNAYLPLFMFLFNHKDGSGTA